MDRREELRKKGAARARARREKEGAVPSVGGVSGPLPGSPKASAVTTFRYTITGGTGTTPGPSAS